MATMQEILDEVGLGEAGHTKTATATTAPSSKEVNDVLDSLGLSNVESVEAAGVTKTASEGRNRMGMTDLYEEIFGGEAAPAATQEKTAAAATEAGEQTEVESQAGELTGIYFNVLRDAAFDKIAGDLEMEAGKGFQPDAGSSGELTKIVGKEGNPRVAVNHDPSSGAGMVANPGNQTPYSLKAKAQIKAILKRRMTSEAGDVGGYNE